MQSERFLSSWTNREDKLRFGYICGNSGIRTDKEKILDTETILSFPVSENFLFHVIVIVSIKVKNPFIFFNCFTETSI